MFLIRLQSSSWDFYSYVQHFKHAHNLHTLKSLEINISILVYYIYKALAAEDQGALMTTFCDTDLSGYFA